MNFALIRKTGSVCFIIFTLGACGDSSDERNSGRKIYPNAKGNVNKQEAPATVNKPKDSRAQSTSEKAESTTEPMSTVGMPQGAPVTLPSTPGSKGTPTPQANGTPTPVSPSVPFANLEAAALNVIKERCVICHGAAPGKGGINGIGDKAKLISSGLVVPKDATNSPLFRAIDSGQMPISGKLPQAQIDAVKNWINSMPL